MGRLVVWTFWGFKSNLGDIALSEIRMAMESEDIAILVNDFSYIQHVLLQLRMMIYIYIDVSTEHISYDLIIY
jgi:hypothetical protein